MRAVVVPDKILASLSDAIEQAEGGRDMEFSLQVWMEKGRLVLYLHPPDELSGLYSDGDPCARFDFLDQLNEWDGQSSDDVHATIRALEDCAEDQKRQFVEYVQEHEPSERCLYVVSANRVSRKEFSKGSSFGPTDPRILVKFDRDEHGTLRATLNTRLEKPLELSPDFAQGWAEKCKWISRQIHGSGTGIGRRLPSYYAV